MTRVAFIFLLIFACTTATSNRVNARLYDGKYFPPYTTYTVVMVGKVPVTTPHYHPEKYILYFDIGEAYGMPAYVSRATYEGAQIGATYDITYSNGEGCTNIRRVTHFN